MLCSCWPPVARSTWSRATGTRSTPVTRGCVGRSRITRRYRGDLQRLLGIGRETARSGLRGQRHQRQALPTRRAGQSDHGSSHRGAIGPSPLSGTVQSGSRAADRAVWVLEELADAEGVPNGSRMPKSMPYGFGAGSSVMSTPRSDSSSKALGASSVERQSQPLIALGEQFTGCSRRVLVHGRRTHQLEWPSRHEVEQGGDRSPVAGRDDHAQFGLVDGHRQPSAAHTVGEMHVDHVVAHREFVGDHSLGLDA
ncbi:hypothetical protein BH23ACT5_BH23ACT5_06920 [soil metagenome]